MKKEENFFEETFCSVCGVPKEEALKVLDDIRKAHSNWEEIDAYIEKRSDGWHAVRKHRRKLIS